MEESNGRVCWPQLKVSNGHLRRSLFEVHNMCLLESSATV
ncbi:unnamed protein product, partial [Musa acuminata subsp. burmannicoides]